MMARAVGLLMLGAAAYAAYGAGYLPEMGALFDKVAGAADNDADAKLTPSGVIDVPQGSAPKPASKEQAHLLTNWDFVSSWSRKNLDLTEAIMWQESRGRADAVSSAGALGLMQVMPGTAQHMANRGNRRFGTDKASLLTPAGSIYFGTHYLEYLAKNQRGRGAGWLIRSYNAGPGDSIANGNPHRYSAGGLNGENDGYLIAVTQRWEEISERRGVQI